MPQPQLISDFKRVAVAGKTADNREIKEQWLKDIEETFDPKVYGARVWPGHLRGIIPGSDFKAQGDVVAVKTQYDTIGGEKKLALYAQIAPLPSLIEMNQKRDKIYTSIEVTPNFAGSGKAYLSGLAVTDSPASLGTEELHFSATRLNTQITDALEVDFAFSEEGADDNGQGGQNEPSESRFSLVLEKIRGAISAGFRKTAPAAGQLEEIAALFESATDEIGKQFAALGEKEARRETAFTELKAEVDKLKANYAKLDNTPANPLRPTASGAVFGDESKTNC